VARSRNIRTNERQSPGTISGATAAAFRITRVRNQKTKVAHRSGRIGVGVRRGMEASEAWKGHEKRTGPNVLSMTPLVAAEMTFRGTQNQRRTNNLRSRAVRSRADRRKPRENPEQGASRKPEQSGSRPPPYSLAFAAKIRRRRGGGEKSWLDARATAAAHSLIYPRN
jgi:hypothetical protein